MVCCVYSSPDSLILERQMCDMRNDLFTGVCSCIDLLLADTMTSCLRKMMGIGTLPICAWLHSLLRAWFSTPIPWRVSVGQQKELLTCSRVRYRILQIHVYSLFALQSQRWWRTFQLHHWEAEVPWIDVWGLCIFTHHRNYYNIHSSNQRDWTQVFFCVFCWDRLKCPIVPSLFA